MVPVAWGAEFLVKYLNGKRRAHPSKKLLRVNLPRHVVCTRIWLLEACGVHPRHVGVDSGACACDRASAVLTNAGANYNPIPKPI